MQHVPKIVLPRLPRKAAAESHPDANLLTAFAERVLGESERARVMDHLSRCGDCREVVAFALPATEVIAVATSTESAGSRWLSWPILRWGVVAAGILLVTSVGVLQYGHRQQNRAVVSKLVLPEQTSGIATQNPSSSVARSEPQAPLPQSHAGKQRQSEKKAPLQVLRTSPSIQPSTGDAVLPPSSSRAFSSAGTGIGGHIVSGPNFGQAAKSSSAALPGTPSPAIPQSSQMIAVQSAPAQFAENQSNQPVQERSLAGVDVVKAKDLAGAQAASPEPSGPVAAPSNALGLPTVQTSPRWAISANGSLQRSFDAGKTWEDVNVSSSPGGSVKQQGAYKAEWAQRKTLKKPMSQPDGSVVFRAVAAIDADVWAGGSGSMLYHSSDSGLHWTRVLPSEAGTVLMGDIIGLEFSDPLSGKVVTSAGEVWTTADAGQTWHKQP